MVPFRVVLSITAAALLFTTGCGIKQLREENEQLKKEVEHLRQVERDYGDKLQALESMSADEKSAMRAEMEQMRNSLNGKLQRQIQENNALVQKVNDLTVIEVGEAALFGSGQADLTKAGTGVIRDMAEVLGQYPGYHIRVEGHTDSVPIGKELQATFATNWELSSARATTVVRYMIYGLRFDRSRLSAVGHADNRPVATNDTQAGRAKNRRIQLVVFKTVE
jgi:chemotaxis protein MotB